MLALVLRWLQGQLSGALGVSVIQGDPAWGRPGLITPLAAVKLIDLGLSPVIRVGQPSTLSRPAARITLFATHEPGLWALVEAFATWADGAAAATVDGRKIGLVFEPGQRYESLTGAEQEQYGFQFTISLAW